MFELGHSVSVFKRVHYMCTYVRVCVRITYVCADVHAKGTVNILLVIPQVVVHVYATSPSVEDIPPISTYPIVQFQ